MAVSKEMERLARQVSQGDEEGLKELIRLGIREGYVRLIGKTGYAVRRMDTGNWLRGGWWRDDDRPHFYLSEKVALRYAKDFFTHDNFPVEIVESAHIIIRSTRLDLSDQTKK